MQSKLLQLDVPVAEIVPDEVVDRIGGFVIPMLSHSRVHGPNALAQPIVNPEQKNCSVL